jgi:phage-related tail protein
MDSMFANSIARAEQGSAKEKELKRKQFIASKVAGIAEAGINIALAITRVLGKPFQNIQIALISALGLGQIAAIAATPMPKFAQGGYSRGGLAMVGEQGPEIVQLPDGSKVIPNNNIKNESFDNRNITINVSSPNAIDFVNQLKRTYGLEVFA